MKQNGCIALSDLPAGRLARLCSHGAPGDLPVRLADLGLVPGTPISLVRRAPLGGPLEVELRGYRLCLRRTEASRFCATLDAHGE